MSDTDKMIPVRFKDLTVWCDPDVLHDGGNGALSPPEHVEDGEIAGLGVALFGKSYAHVYEDGRILRYGEQIGVRADLIPEEAPTEAMTLLQPPEPKERP